MRTITAFYDSRSDAESARQRLSAAGIEPGAVQITPQDGGGSGELQPSSGGSSDGGHGFMASLKNFFMPHEDRHAYSEGMRRGGCLLTAEVSEAQADDVCRILDETDAVNIEERQSQWASEGWQPDGWRTGSGQTTQGLGQGAMATGAANETIPIVDEELRVGKREVERGSVRVRSYVEETPVQEQVTLRDEHVEIERRPAGQHLGAGQADNLFQERTIELTERGEEAVVAKEAVVREEIAVHKDVDQHTETISDTVRHTRVDVDDTRGGQVQGGQSQRFSEPASFASGSHDRDRSMDSDTGGRVGETEEERRQRLLHQRPSSI